MSGILKNIRLIAAAALIFCVTATACIFPSAEPSATQPQQLPSATAGKEEPDIFLGDEGCEASAGGRFVLTDKYLYYIDTDGAINRLPVDGGEAEQLVPAGEYACLNVMGGYIYYLDNTSGIYRCATNSGEAQRLSALTADKLSVRSDGLYYLCAGALWYCSLQGESEQLIYDGIEDFLICGDYVIAVAGNDSYGFDLRPLGADEPFATQAALYTVKDGTVYAETSRGLFCYEGEDFAPRQLPGSFELLPDGIAACDEGILYSPRGTDKVVLRDMITGFEQTVLEDIDEFFVAGGDIIYQKDGRLYAANCNGWQRRLLRYGLPGKMLLSALECSSVTLKCDTDTLHPGQSAMVSVHIDGAPASFQQLMQLSCYIKDNTVLTVSPRNDGLCIYAAGKGETVLRVSTAQKNVFAELLLRVE